MGLFSCWLCAIFGLRLVFKSYKRILRYGSIHALDRELLACVIAACLLVILTVLVGRMVPVLRVTVTYMVSFVSGYTVISMLMRISYCYLYRLSKKDTRLSKMLKKSCVFVRVLTLNLRLLVEHCSWCWSLKKSAYPHQWAAAYRREVCNPRWHYCHHSAQQRLYQSYL